MSQSKDLATACREAGRLWPDHVALHFDATGEHVTFAELDKKTSDLAEGWLQIGITPGEAVAVMLPNIMAYPLVWLSLAKIGARIVPINAKYRDADASFVVKHSGARVLVVSQTNYDIALRLKSALPHVEHLVSAGKAISKDFVSLEDLGEGSGNTSVVAVGGETIANIQYTSGTTGMPKGCLLSHAYWLNIGHGVIAASPCLRSNDVILTAQPFSYMDPHWNLVAALLSGATLVVLERFSPSTFWSKITQYGVTFFYCLGAMPTLMLATPPSADERCHRVRQIRCSAIPSSRHAELEARFRTPWIEVYGTTECGGVLKVEEADAARLVGSGAMGTALPGREVRVMDQDGRPVPRGQEGELVVRGIAMMDGYHKDVNATEQAYRAGWYRTGDIVQMDVDGFVFFRGRLKDMIRRGGENIAAAEVEEVLQTHPDVALAACIAVPDDLRGEEIKAYIVLRDTTQTASPERLISFASSRLAAFKVPRYWTFLPQLPSTPSERIAKHLLDVGAACFDRTIGFWLEDGAVSV